LNVKVLGRIMAYSFAKSNSPPRMFIAPRKPRKIKKRASEPRNKNCAPVERMYNERMRNKMPTAASKRPKSRPNLAEIFKTS